VTNFSTAGGRSRTQYPFFLVEDFANLRDYDVTAVEGEYDLFGDGRVVTVPTPGHTPGHQSVQVRLGGETVILAADIAYCREAYEEMLWTFFDWSIEATCESIRAIRHRAAVEDATMSIIHDPDDLDCLRDLTA
jgi:glyoxylase-like metal-dependent hydrolase (beta-lactamase superfamily II)